MYTLYAPASSANFCVGFDAAGLAVAIYNKIVFEARPHGLVIEMEPDDPRLPRDERNLIVRAARRAADAMGKPLPGLYMKQYNNIPGTRGLGSSASCIVAGIMIADKLLGSRWSKQQMLDLATDMEGHPDNAAPTIFGGACISIKTDTGVFVRRLPTDKTLGLCVVIPSFTLSTKKAREVLPAQISRADAVSNIARMGLLVSALYENDYALLKTALHDRLHEPYRKPLIPGFDSVVEAAYSLGAYGACLSGAGPTIITFIDGCDTSFVPRLNEKLSGISGGWQAVAADFDRRGAYIE